MGDTRGALGQLMYAIIAAFAEFASNSTKERTAEGMRRAKERGSQVDAKLQRGARRLTELSRYRKLSASRLSQYAREMRSWPGFEADEGVYDHVLRYLPHDSGIFAAMCQGDEYPAALKVAIELFETEAHRRRIKRDSAEWKQLFRAMAPPCDPSKFPNRWWKLRTLMAHIGNDTYSHMSDWAKRNSSRTRRLSGPVRRMRIKWANSVSIFLHAPLTSAERASAHRPTDGSQASA